MSTISIDGALRFADYMGRADVFNQSIQGGSTPDDDWLYTQAYDKFTALAHSKVSAAMAVNLAEISATFKMVQKRLTQLHDFTVALEKRDFGGVVRALGFGKDETFRLGKRSARLARDERTRRLRTVWDRQAVKPATFANNYLEYVFGWQPVVQDIGKALLVLSRPFKVDPIKGYAEKESRSGSVIPLIWNVQPSQVETYKRVSKMLLCATVRVTNPNLLLANELGVANLAQIAWNITPYSFLIDAFTGVSRYLGSYSDFWGLELVNGYRSFTTDSVFERKVDYQGMVGRGREEYWEHGYRAQREVPFVFSVPSLKSRIALPTGNLGGRLASTAALLVQRLANRK